MNEDYKLKPIAYGSEDYAAEVCMREAVLRKPLGLAFSAEERDADKDSFHLGCFLSGVLTGCLVLTPLSADEIKMRQVAIDPDLQGRGAGRALVEYSERFARERGFKRMVLHARKTAVPFYEKLGYVRHGKEFTEVTVPHWNMSKDLE